MYIFLVIIQKAEYNSKVGETKERQENFVYGKGKRNQNECNAYLR